MQLAGSWKMSGHQEGFNNWKADLNLKKDGSLEWTETEGANVGANRHGNLGVRRYGPHLEVDLSWRRADFLAFTVSN